MPMLPPIPFAAAALMLGVLGGVVGTKTLEPVETMPAISAQAAILPPLSAAPGTSAPADAVRRSPDGLFYLWAKVNGRPIRFMVDTGASVVVLRAADAAAVGATPGTFDGRMETASGSAPMAWTRLDEIRVGGRRVSGLRAAVVKDKLGVSLLGANMLARLGSVHISGDRLELR